MVYVTECAFKRLQATARTTLPQSKPGPRCIRIAGMTSDSDYRLNRRLRRFLSAVEGLEASEWGQLEAAAARMSSRDLAGFLDRTSYLGSALSGLMGAGELLTVPAAAALQAGGWAVGNFADGVRIVCNRPRPSPLASSVAEELERVAARRKTGASFADDMDMLGALERLSRCTLNALGSADSPRSADPLFLLLSGAAMAVALSHRFGAERTARLYAPVEPVIPWASLDEAEPPAALPEMVDEQPL